MNAPTNLYKAYSRATHTVAKTRQVVMLYDGAIRFLNQAREAMENGAIEQRFKTLSRASDIITGLQACLDFDAGASAAQTLYDFYSAIDMRILQLHRTNDVAECQQLIGEVKAMREVWNTIDLSTASTAATPSATEPVPTATQPGLQPVTVSA